MARSTEQELSELHGAIARVLISQLNETITITDDDGMEAVVATATPATLGVAIKFLKDNDITASIADDENMNELDEMLKRKREKRGLRLASSSD
jgi:AAA+ superfamily predicted ATPase